jgi:hypothetical protein
MVVLHPSVPLSVFRQFRYQTEGMSAFLTHPTSCIVESKLQIVAFEILSYYYNYY